MQLELNSFAVQKVESMATLNFSLPGDSTSFLLNAETSEQSDRRAFHLVSCGFFICASHRGLTVSRLSPQKRFAFHTDSLPNSGPALCRRPVLCGSVRLSAAFQAAIWYSFTQILQGLGRCRSGAVLIRVPQLKHNEKWLVVKDFEPSLVDQNRDRGAGTKKSDSAVANRRSVTRGPSHPDEHAVFYETEKQFTWYPQLPKSGLS